LFLKRAMQIIALSAVCPPLTLSEDFKNYPDCNACKEILRDIRIPPEEMFVDCNYKNEVVNCRDVLKEMVVQNLLCYTFNGVEIYRHSIEPKTVEWSIDDGYKPTATLETYPHRILEAGIKFGFSIFLRLHQQDLEYACFGEPGFWVNCDSTCKYFDHYRFSNR